MVLALACFGYAVAAWFLFGPVVDGLVDMEDLVVVQVLYAVMGAWLLLAVSLPGPLAMLQLRSALKKGMVGSEAGALTESHAILAHVVRIYYLTRYGMFEGMALIALVILFFIPEEARSLQNAYYAGGIAAMIASGTIGLMMFPSFSRVESLVQGWREKLDS